MNHKIVLRSLVCVLLIAVTATFSNATPAMKFDPSGTWVYSAPGVAEGYTTGEIIIVEKEDGYGVTNAINEYKVEAHKVEYNDKSLTYSLYVDTELVTISGTFKKDKFTGTVSYYEGEFNFSAVRKEEVKEE